VIEVDLFVAPINGDYLELAEVLEQAAQKLRDKKPEGKLKGIGHVWTEKGIKYSALFIEEEE